VKLSDRLLGIGIPAIVFVAVWAFHYLWHGVFPEQAPLQSHWVEVAVADDQWWDRYVATQSYWLSFSYALSLAFAAYAFQRYRRDCYCVGRKLAIGSMTLTGSLAIVGCFLIGCCGSPMLPVYLSLFGAGFISLAKPSVALVTLGSIVAAWFYLHFKRPSAAPCSDAVDMGCG
jgi:MFS family permease